MKLRFKHLPGIALAFGLTIIAIVIANFINGFLGGSNPLSPIFIGVLIGILISNTIGVAERFQSGIQYTVKVILKLGIILLGIRLSFLDVITLGLWGIPIIVACIIAGIFFTLWMTKRLGVSERLGLLTAGGTSICGITAIMSIAPSIKAKEAEISYAVANITIFGLISMFVYPYVAHIIFNGDPTRIGLFLGTAIHDTAQVVGASLIYDGQFASSRVVDVATITKLTRNVFLIAVVPLMTLYAARRLTNTTTDSANVKKWYEMIPYFIFGFLALSIVRTVGDATMEQSGQAFGLFSSEGWHQIHTLTSDIGTTYLLGMAMVAVGLTTNLKKLRSLGVKPFIIGMSAALSVSVMSLVMVFLLGGLI